MTWIPRFWRRRVYKRILAYAKTVEDMHLCHAPAKYWPHSNISKYPELYNKRPSTSTTIQPFKTHEERIAYIEEAIREVS